jgi:formylglycine-generating enzyme required for sulfatase activity
MRANYLFCGLWMASSIAFAVERAGLEPAPQPQVSWTETWMGWFYVDGDWMLHTEHGWLFCSGGPDTRMWAYDLRLEQWVYFAQNLYPYLYMGGEAEGWYIYAEGGRAGSRYFYSMPRGDWFIEGLLFEKSEMVRIEEAVFSMQDYWSDTGAPRGDPRMTTLSSYQIARTEVTHGLWKEVRAWAVENGYETLGSLVGRGCADNHPVIDVNWYDAVKWCNARSEKEGLVPVYYLDDSHTEVYRTGEAKLTASQVDWSANGYRLPTEAEWEYAARGGADSPVFLYSGSDDIEQVAWYGFNSDEAPCSFNFGKGTFPVASKKSNHLGLHDLSGNVSEWCWDNPGLYQESATGVNPRGPASVSSFDQGERILRGGGFTSIEYECEVLQRRDQSARLRQPQFGFRLAQSLAEGD